MHFQLFQLDRNLSEVTRVPLIYQDNLYYNKNLYHNITEINKKSLTRKDDKRAHLGRHRIVICKLSANVYTVKQYNVLIGILKANVSVLSNHFLSATNFSRQSF